MRHPTDACRCIDLGCVDLVQRATRPLLLDHRHAERIAFPRKALIRAVAGRGFVKHGVQKDAAALFLRNELIFVENEGMVPSNGRLRTAENGLIVPL
jgi:hypothetical protein